MKRLNFLFAFVLCAAFFSVSCNPVEKPEQEEKSDKAYLSSFSLLKSDNPGLTDAVKAYISGQKILFSIPEEMNPAALVPSLSTAPKSEVFINDARFEAGKAYNFTDGAVVKVVSESGKRTVNYTVAWERGDNFIDCYIYQLIDECDIPGVSLSIMKGSKVVYSKGYGYADVSRGEKTTPDHLFRMASISKQFCTLCIMMLKEQGKLKLDDRVFGEGAILDGLYEGLTSYHKSITVRQLLSHSSGICAGLDDPAFNNSYRFYDGDSNRPVPTDVLIQRTINVRQYPYVNSSGTSYSPGENYNYSNVGFCILHRIVEVLSGKDYESYLKEDVLAKMDVTDTHIGGYQKDRRPNECVFYSQSGGNGYLNPLRELAGAAGIITSTNQMMKVLTYIDGDDTVPDIFSKETLSEMYTPFAYSGSTYNKYGLGWRLNNAKRFYGSHMHGGNIAGTATFWVGGAKGDELGSYSEPMSGAIICNSRSYDNKITWNTSWGTSSGNDIDDSFYIILGEAFRHFK